MFNFFNTCVDYCVIIWVFFSKWNRCLVFFIYFRFVHFLVITSSTSSTSDTFISISISLSLSRCHTHYLSISVNMKMKLCLFITRTLIYVFSQTMAATKRTAGLTSAVPRATLNDEELVRIRTLVIKKIYIYLYYIHKYVFLQVIDNFFNTN